MTFVSTTWFVEYHQITRLVKNSGDIEQFNCLFSIQPSSMYGNSTKNIETSLNSTIYSNILALALTQTTTDFSNINRTDLVLQALSVSRRRRMRNLNDTESENITITTTTTTIDEALGVINISDTDYCDVFVFFMYHTPNASFDYSTETSQVYYEESLELENGTTITVNIPVCQYYDEASGGWSDEGCWAIFTNETVTKCSCNHLTKFSVTSKDFVPSVNAIDLTRAQNLTFTNLALHPTSWISIVLILIVFGIIIVCVPRTNDKPMIAQIRPWTALQSSKYTNEDNHYNQYNKIILDRRASVFNKYLRFFWTSMKNTHPILSIWMRGHGMFILCCVFVLIQCEL